MADIRQGDYVRVTRTFTEVFEGRVLVHDGKFLVDDADGCRRSFLPDSPEVSVEVTGRPDPARVHQRTRGPHGTIVVEVDEPGQEG